MTTPTPGANVCPDCGRRIGVNEGECPPEDVRNVFGYAEHYRLTIARLRAENEALDKRCDELAAGVDGYEKQAAKYRAIAAENEALRAGRAATGEREAGRAEGLEEAAREAERERDACDIKGAQDHRGGNREMWRAWAYKSDTARVIAARIRALIPAQPSLLSVAQRQAELGSDIALEANREREAALDTLEGLLGWQTLAPEAVVTRARKVLINAGRLPAKEG